MIAKQAHVLDLLDMDIVCGILELGESAPRLLALIDRVNDIAGRGGSGDEIVFWGYLPRTCPDITGV